MSPYIKNLSDDAAAITSLQTELNRIEKEIATLESKLSVAKTKQLVLYKAIHAILSENKGTY